MAKITIILIVTALIFTYFVFSLNAFPLLGCDSGSYLPPAINFSNSKGLINEYDLTTFTINEFNNSNNPLFNYYPPLHALTLSFLMIKGSTQNLLFVLALLSSLILILTALSLYKISTRQDKNISSQTVLVICISLLSLSSSLVTRIEGRPEILASIYLIGGILCIITLHEVLNLFILGILVGLMGATHPFGLIISSLAITAFYSFKYNYKKLLINIFLLHVIAFISFLIAMSLSPYNIFETIKGLTLNLKFYPFVITKFNFWQYFLFDIKFPFYGLVFLISLSLSLYFYYKNHNKVASPKVFLISLILIFIAYWYIVYRTPNRIYYLFMLMPLMYIPITYYFAVYKNKGLKIKVISIIFLLLTTIGFFRFSLLFPICLRHGMSIDKARTLLNELDGLKENKNSKIVIYGTDLWILFEDYSKIVQYGRADTNPEKNNLLLYQQNYSGLKKPPLKIDNYKLIRDYFVRHEPKIFMLWIANTTPGYAFAVYKFSKN